MESNLFIGSSLKLAGEFYQHLLRGIVTFEELGNRIIKQIETAYAFRQVERVRELARILINVPIREHRLIAQYYLVWCKCQDLQFHSDILERIVEQTSTYKAKALISRAAFDVYQDNVEQALHFYTEALKTEPTPSDFIKASTGIATIKSIEGFHASALKDLERLLPLLKHAEPLTYFEVINSNAVELIANNRFDEALNASAIAAASPFGPFYPEWQETYSDVRSSRKRRSTVSIPHSQERTDEVEEVEPTGNVIQFPTGEPVADLNALFKSLELSGLSITPLQLLGVILRAVLKDRITDAEIDKICTVYHDTVVKWYWLS